jgi:Zn-dependent M28 family amino/carboxypeptidase
MAAILVVSAMSLACSPGSAGQSFASDARRHMDVLSEEIGTRTAGSEEERRAADYIAEAFAGMGYAVERQSFALRPRGQTSSNVIAFKNGLSDREIIVGAHFDSESMGRGAGDNASGVSLMLTVADRLRDVDTPYSIRLVAFGAEESGLAGSAFFVSRMSDSEVDNTVAMINLDSLIVGEIAYVYGNEGEGGVVRDWILERARAEGVDLVTQPGANPEFPAGTTCDCSDHAPFVERGIRYAYFESTNWSLGDNDGYVQVDPRYGQAGRVWHTPYDTIEYIDGTFPGRADARFDLLGTMLIATLTEFTIP